MLKNALEKEGIILKYQDHAFVDPRRKIDCIPWRDQLKKIGAYDA